MSHPHPKQPKRRSAWLRYAWLICRMWERRALRAIENFLFSIVRRILRYKSIFGLLYAIACVCVLWSIWSPMLQPISSLTTATSVTTSVQVAQPEEKADRNISFLMDLLTLGVAVVGLYLLNIRLKRQDKQIAMQAKQFVAQTKKDVDDRFYSAVALLSSDDASVRTEAIYSLHQVAVESEDHRNQYPSRVAKTLCAHIRAKTMTSAYWDTHAKNPSDEIQAAIDVLFKGVNGAQGLYSKFSDVLPPANLTNAYLAGANFARASCQKAIFKGAQCRRVNFFMAQCQGANFKNSRCRGAAFQAANFYMAILERAHFHGADFRGACLHNTDLTYAFCNGADLRTSNCQGAHFDNAICHGANFGGAHCQGGFFVQAHCHGVNFAGTYCHGTDFSEALCHGADFSYARCQGAIYASTYCHGACALKSDVSFYKKFLADPHATMAKIFGRVSNILLPQRIDQCTELETMIVSGELDNNEKLAIKLASHHMSDEWLVAMERIIEENKGRHVAHGSFVGILRGKLEKTAALDEIIGELKEIWGEVVEFHKEHRG